MQKGQKNVVATFRISKYIESVSQQVYVQGVFLTGPPLKITSMVSPNHGDGAFENQGEQLFFYTFPNLTQKSKGLTVIVST